MINVQAVESSHFILYYKAFQDNEENYLPAGQMEEQSINLKEKNKSFIILNPYTQNKNTFLINIDSLNCQIKSIFNKTEYSNSKQNQIYIEPSDPIYSSGEYEITIELLSFDTGRTSENEKCIFYLGGFEINSENPIPLTEGINYSFEISSSFKSLHFVYEFKMTDNQNNNNTIEDVTILFDKNGKGNLLVTAYSEQGLKEFFISDSYTFNALTLSYKFFFPSQYGKNLDTYILNLTVEYYNKSETSDIPFDIEIMGTRSTPFYLPVGEMLLDVIMRNKYQYFYSDVKSNSYGEIIINFKQGTGDVIGRIVHKNDIDSNANWNKRVKLPLINDTNSSLNGIIKFDYYNKKIVFTEEDTKNCDDGCEIYIGIISNEKGGGIQTNLIDYSIFMRYDDTFVELEQDEYVFGSLSKTIEENEMDYFIIDVVKDTDRIIIEFDSELSEIYVKKGNEKPTSTSYDHKITSDNTFFEIPANLNDKFSFAVSTKELDQYSTSFYSFKVIFPDKGVYPYIQRIESSQNEFCIIDNSDSKKNRCLFLIPIYSYNTIIRTYFYAKNEDYPDNNNITIYGKEVDETFELENSKISLFPSDETLDEEGVISNIENKYLLITITSSNNWKDSIFVFLFSSFNLYKFKTKF